MNTQSLGLHVSPEIGNVSAEYLVPEESSCLLTLAHGAGAGMNHPFMVALATSLAGAGIATLRFNFPFMENNKRRADVPAVAHKTIEAAITNAGQSFPSFRLCRCSSPANLSLLLLVFLTALPLYSVMSLQPKQSLLQ